MTRQAFQRLERDVRRTIEQLAYIFTWQRQKQWMLKQLDIHLTRKVLETCRILILGFTSESRWNLKGGSSWERQR